MYLAVFRFYRLVWKINYAKVKSTMLLYFADNIFFSDNNMFSLFYVYQMLMKIPI